MIVYLQEETANAPQQISKRARIQHSLQRKVCQQDVHIRVGALQQERIHTEQQHRVSHQVSI